MLICERNFSATVLRENQKQRMKPSSSKFWMNSTWDFNLPNSGRHFYTPAYD